MTPLCYLGREVEPPVDMYKRVAGVSDISHRHRPQTPRTRSHRQYVKQRRITVSTHYVKERLRPGLQPHLA